MWRDRNMAGMSKSLLCMDFRFFVAGGVNKNAVGKNIR